MILEQEEFYFFLEFVIYYEEVPELCAIRPCEL